MLFYIPVVVFVFVVVVFGGWGVGGGMGEFYLVFKDITSNRKTNTITARWRKQKQTKMTLESTHLFHGCYIRGGEGLLHRDWNTIYTWNVS